MLLLHYTAMACGKAAVKWLCDTQSKVSAHYLIDVDGSVVQMVRESERAWHAGVSYWAGETDINSCSIGIEIQNEGHMLDVLPAFPEAQMQAIENLCSDIIQRHDISPSRILGHSDVAPGRKIDPGEAFDWKRLYNAGVGHWVEPIECMSEGSLDLGDHGEDVVSLQKMLRDYGYGIEPNGIYDASTQAVVFAFQQHWRQSCVDGKADMSTLQTLEKLSLSLQD